VHLFAGDALRETIDVAIEGTRERVCVNCDRRYIGTVCPNCDGMGLECRSVTPHCACGRIAWDRRIKWKRVKGGLRQRK
jgi:hypothetical protein